MNERGREKTCNFKNSIFASASLIIYMCINGTQKHTHTIYSY